MSKKLLIDEYRDGGWHPDPDKWNFCYITPEELMQLQAKSNDGTRKLTLEHAKKLAMKADKGEVCDCGNDRIWQFGECGMCFGCTTGETDRSEDFELTMDKNKKPHFEL